LGYDYEKGYDQRIGKVTVEVCCVRRQKNISTHCDQPATSAPETDAKAAAGEK